MSDRSAADVVAALLRVQDTDQLASIRKRLAPDEDAFGMRMRDLFDVAKAHADLDHAEIERLLDHPAYEPRLAALCILDFQARKPITDNQRERLYQTYLDRHDRITTWDMVDRSAPRVVGRHLAGRSSRPLYELAEAAEPLRRRTAITATLYHARYGTDEDLADGFGIADRLAADPEPVVHNAVGIFLKHAGTRDPEALLQFLDAHAAAMQRPALRLAIAKLDPTTRTRYLRS
ncbi:DNA alkylation repair protein [Haloactinopolyspora sp.]|uniref:DNA alkylation repair protein n=1 Tax=Haloactinopolyspora sp. TaxID=1966353 RepID=UPI0026212A4E|nr:DNA alkylation repair protein [Haloactinopolyspora sp.]